MKVIAFLGKEGAGKDTACQCLSQIVPTKRFAFADRLKDIAREIGWNGEKDFKGRRFLQHLGQTAREYKQTIWAEYAVKQMKALESSNDYVCFAVTDVRFKNELACLRHNFDDVVTIRIVGRQSDLGDNSKDISETEVDNVKVDYTVVNDGTVQDLKDSIAEVYKSCISSQ